MISVTCAVIRNDDDEVLVVQRGEATDHPFKWEFPGGKLAAGETEEDCILREIAEELSMEVVICGRLSEVEHDYGHKKIRLIPFICYTLDDLPMLAEHLAYRWLSADELLTMDYSGADVYVAESYLKSIMIERKEEKPVTHNDTVVTPGDVSGLKDMVSRVRSTREAEWVATSAIENPAIFDKLLEFSFSKDSKLAFHASWALSKACDKSPQVAYPIIPGIIEALDKVINDSALRSFLRIISLSDLSQISSKHQGIIAGYCFEALKSAFSSIAVKAYSMEILYRLALIYPELTNELAATISMLQGEGSAGVLARGHAILKKLAVR